MNNKDDKTGLWEWVKAISVLLLVGVGSYKIYITPFNITVDFPTLLSLLLAMFSVGLAALFYFKATETSNTFYDNTYNFTKDIAQLLVKIESGFGERLKHLDEGYTSMRDHLQNSPDRGKNEAVEQTKKKINVEKQEIEKVASERNEIIQHLVERSQLQETEKKNVLNDLKQKEEELIDAQKELSKMNRRLAVERMKRNRSNSKSQMSGFNGYTREHVVDVIGASKILKSSLVGIKRSFERLLDNLPSGYIEDMESEGYFDEGLTREGASYLRQLAKDEDV